MSPRRTPFLITKFVVEGFTLAELLIALAILGVIAVFIIPKVLQSQQEQRYNSTAKESAAAITSIYQNLLMNGKTQSSVSRSDIVANLNYVKQSTSTLEGTHNTVVGSFWSCADAEANDQACLVMANGGVIQIIEFNTGFPCCYNVQVFVFDPDSAGPAERVAFFLVVQDGFRVGQLKAFLWVLPIGITILLGLAGINNYVWEIITN